MENFENKINKKETKPEVEEYFDAYKEWSDLSNELSKLFTDKKILDIAENLKAYKLADKRLIEKANKINAPLPDDLLVDIAHEYLNNLVKEIKQKSKEESQE